MRHRRRARSSLAERVLSPSAFVSRRARSSLAERVRLSPSAFVSCLADAVSLSSVPRTVSDYPLASFESCAAGAPLPRVAHRVYPPRLQIHRDELRRRRDGV